MASSTSTAALVLAAVLLLHSCAAASPPEEEAAPLTQDIVTLRDWYVGYQYPGSQYHVEQFQTSDGKTLLDSQVQNLVSAMAAFAPPTAGQTTLAANYEAVLTPVLAANWR